MILIDNTQLLLSSIFTQIHDVSILDEGIVRHIALNTYRHYRTKFRGKYGELVLCQDSGDCWRKGVFPLYKANRKKDREGNEDKWERVFGALNKIREEVRDHFPYKQMKVRGCEADDIIGVLVKRFHGDEPILIVSSDKDFFQLHKYEGVAQYSPMAKKMVRCDDPQGTLTEHIIRGDSGDGIPNILSDDDTLATEGKRQKPVTAKRMKELQESLVFGNLFSDESVRKNWERNRTLIDLSQIPPEVEERVINTWEEPIGVSRSGLLNYFMEHRLKNLMECIGEF